MVTVGVRELRQRASELLRKVRAGESIRVTDRGEPVAMMVPIADVSPLQRLEIEGRVTGSAGDLLDLGVPLPATAGAPLPSAVLAALRDDET